MKNKGWRKHPIEHGLAAKGIKTKQIPNSQYKKIFPKTHWKIDSDKDKKINKDDCYPFDPLRQDLFRGASADRFGSEVSFGKYPNQYGITAGFSKYPAVAQQFAKGKRADRNPIQLVGVFDDSIKEVLNPVKYDHDWFQKNKDVYMHVTDGEFDPTWTNLMIYRNEGEYFTRGKPIDLNNYLKSVNAYITPRVVINFLESKGYATESHDESSRQLVEEASKRYDIPINDDGDLWIRQEDYHKFIDEIIDENKETLPKNVPISIYTRNDNLLDPDYDFLKTIDLSKEGAMRTIRENMEGL
jgi:hypothetical protein